MFNVLDQDKSFQMLENAMDVASARHSLIASNLANIDTPGYKAKDIAFKEELNIALTRAMNSDMKSTSGSFSFSSSYEPQVHQVEGVTPRQDGNTVDLDKELGKLAKTTSVYSKATTLYSMKLKMVNRALQGG